MPKKDFVLPLPSRIGLDFSETIVTSTYPRDFLLNQLSQGFLIKGIGGVKLVHNIWK